MQNQSIQSARFTCRVIDRCYQRNKLFCEPVLDQSLKSVGGEGNIDVHGYRFKGEGGEVHGLWSMVHGLWTFLKMSS